jgi:hypothetical protein
MERPFQRRLEILAVAVLFTLWGGAGFVADDRGHTEAPYGPDYVVGEVAAGTTLEEAGFRAGDRVTTVEGRPVGELGMPSRWPRSLSREPGETLEVTVDRGGEAVSLTLTYRERPAAVVLVRRVGGAMAMVFLWLGMAVLFTTPTPHAHRFALVGLAASLAVPGPDLGGFNGVADHIQVAGTILFLIVLLHFFLLFPTAKGVAKSRWVGLLYVPWLALVGCLILELVLHPRLYLAFGGFVGILAVGYLLATVAVVIQAVATAGLDAPSTRGLGWVLTGWGIAVIPNAVAVVGWYVPPGLDTPGQDVFPYFVVAIPLTLALAVRIQARDPR